MAIVRKSRVVKLREILPAVELIPDDERHPIYRMRRLKGCEPGLRLNVTPKTIAELRKLADVLPEAVEPDPPAAETPEEPSEDPIPET